MNLSPDEFPKLGQPIPPDFMSTADKIAKVYAMVTNIDTNVGRVLFPPSRRRAGLALRDTIVIFSDRQWAGQGPFQRGACGWKGTVYDAVAASTSRATSVGRFDSLRVAWSIVDRGPLSNLFPTLLAACGVARPEGLGLDGRSLMPLLTGEAGASLAGPHALLFSGIAVIDPSRIAALRRSLAEVQAPSCRGAAREPEDSPAPALRHGDRPRGAAQYRRRTCPTGRRAIARGVPRLVQGRGRDACFQPVRIAIGGERENPTILTRQDWRGPRSGWGLNDQGHWEVEVSRSGSVQK